MLSTFGSDVTLGTKEKTFEPGDKWAAFLAADVASYCVSGGRHGDSLSFEFLRKYTPKETRNPPPSN